MQQGDIYGADLTPRSDSEQREDGDPWSLSLMMVSTRHLECGILSHGSLRLGRDTCKQEVLLAFSCKRRGFCPSCGGRRMAQIAAHLVERVIPWVPTRQWMVPVPLPATVV